MSEYMSTTEKRIVGAIIRKALGLGYVASVNDGGEWTLKRSDNQAAIMAALASTDHDKVAFYTKDGQTLGCIVFIWGNDEDVVSDHTDNKAMAELVGF